MYIVGVGGTVSPSSSSDRALRIALDHAEQLGAQTRMFSGGFLRQLPLYDPTASHRTDAALELVRELRRADGVILSGAAYHGSVSGMLKNALDYTEDMSQDERVYFAGLPIGMITVAKGRQAGSTTLATLRAIVHSLRGWPTPYGCVINTDKGACAPGEDPVMRSMPSLLMVAEEVIFGSQRLRGAHLVTAVG